MIPRWILVAGGVLVPASVVARVLDQQTATFVLSAAAVVPLAGLLGQATEELALHAGPRIGGLLNATFGNAAELIIGILLVSRGKIAVVEASITGSILGNLLLVLGAAFFAGGLRRKELQFSAQAAGSHVASMALAVAGILMPTIYAHTEKSSHFRLETISVGVAVVLILLYVASLVFSLVTNTDAFGTSPHDEDDGPPAWSQRRALLVLAVAGILVGLESEMLVGALESAVHSLRLSELWVGLILVPIVGNAAEHSTAVVLAMKGKAEIALDIAVGSSAQIALLVTPVLVFVGLIVGHDLTLTFSTFEVGAIALAVVIVSFISQDGRTNWLEGAQLIGVYGILGVSSFFLGKA
jgi:Ca2+:H+ antiporter